MDWVQQLQWPDLPKYLAAKRKALLEPLDGQTDTFVKAYKKFKFYWVLRGGHSVRGVLGVNVSLWSFVGFVDCWGFWGVLGRYRKKRRDLKENKLREAIKMRVRKVESGGKDENGCRMKKKGRVS